MKKITRIEEIAYLGFFLLWLTIGLILLGIQGWLPSLFILVPLPFTSIIYFSFLLTLKGRHGIELVVYTVLRMTILFAMILVPAATWYFIPACHDEVTAFYLLLSPFEALSVYILALVFLLLNKRNGSRQER